MVDRGGLENRCTLTGTKGSNPFLSAIDAYTFLEQQAAAHPFSILNVETAVVVTGLAPYVKKHQKHRGEG